MISKLEERGVFLIQFLSSDGGTWTDGFYISGFTIDGALAFCKKRKRHDDYRLIRPEIMDSDLLVLEAA